MGELASLIERFKLMFPNRADAIASYGQSGKHSCHIITEGKDILVWTYKDEDTWSLMTMKGYTYMLEAEDKRKKKGAKT